MKTHTHTCTVHTYTRIHMHTGTPPNVILSPSLPLPPVTHTLTRKVTDVCISNGMAWSPGNTKMYHMDSGLRKLWSFNFDDVSSYLTNRQVCWWTSTTRGWGIPDAMCMDSEGRLWRAGLFGATIVLVGPSHGIAIGQHRVPSPSHDVVLLLGGGGGGRAPLMTSCCFRGPDFSGCLLPTLH